MKDTLKQVLWDPCVITSSNMDQSLLVSGHAGFCDELVLTLTALPLRTANCLGRENRVIEDLKLNKQQESTETEAPQESPEDLDSDDDLVPYDMSFDKKVSKVQTPKFIRECMEEAGAVPDFNTHRSSVMVALAVQCPKEVSVLSVTVFLCCFGFLLLPLRNSDNKKDPNKKTTDKRHVRQAVLMATSIIMLDLPSHYLLTDLQMEMMETKSWLEAKKNILLDWLARSRRYKETDKTCT